MNERELAQYKDVLLNEKKEILDELLESDAVAREILENELHTSGDTVDIASVSVTQNLLNVTSAKNRQTLAGIEAALRRVDEGTFGVCVSCGKDVGRERLEALPWAAMCITCKTENEKAQNNK